MRNFANPAILIATLAVMTLACGCAESTEGSDATFDRTFDSNDIVDGGCPDGSTLCSGLCVDTLTDRNNCGSCGHRCQAEQICSSGRCMLQCPPFETDCGSDCYDLRSDHENCGACGHACEPNQVCSGGICTSNCDPGLTNCDGSCVDLSTNTNHCGICGRACNDDEVCLSGNCTGGCGNGLCGVAAGETPCTCPEDCETCTGCCTAEGECLPGTSVDACGTGGVECAVCSSGSTCSAGRCTCLGTTCGSECCSSGEVCIRERCCDPTWSTPFPNSFLTGLDIDNDGTIYVTGTGAGSEAYAAALDVCGNLLDETHFPVLAPQNSAMPLSIAIGDMVYLAGQVAYSDESSDAFVARLTKSPLRLDSVNIAGVSPQEEIWDIELTSNGYLWASGTTNYPVAARTWIIKSTTDGVHCDWQRLDPLAGVSRGVKYTGSSIFITGSTDARMYLLRYNETSCSVYPPCPCAPDWQLLFDDQLSPYLEGRGVAVSGSIAYVGGFRQVSGNDYAPALAAVNVSSSRVERWAASWNPSPVLDAYLSISAAATYIVAVGGYGWSDNSGADASTGFIRKLRTSDLAEEWRRMPAGVTLVVDVAIDAAEGIIVTANTSSSSGSVKRCLISGVCP